MAERNFQGKSENPKLKDPPGHGKIKQVQELFQWSLVHAVHEAHLGDQEIQDTATSGDGSELLASCRDLCVRLVGNL